MKALRYLMFASIAIVVLGYVAGYFMPRQWSASATATIAAESAAIHAWVEDPRKLCEWIPWRAKDPNTRFAFHGAERGVGAVLRWESDKVGRATLSITRADPAVGIAYDLVFDGNPNASHGRIEYAPAPGGTVVTWTDGGELDTNPAGRLFRTLVERQLALDFRAGLATLAEKLQPR